MRCVFFLSIFFVAGCFAESSGNAHYKVYFSPDDQVADKLVTLINNEQKSIKVAVYSFTHRDVISALVRAKKRGVDVEVVVDPFSVKAKSPLHRLVKAEIPVFVWDPRTVENRRCLMHDKFCIFGNHTVWTGSFNFTYDATTSHQENALVLKGDELAKKYAEQFEKIKNRGCSPYLAFVKTKKDKHSRALAAR